MSAPSIRTTVVGSYPVPAWLGAYPSEPHLRDAIMVVLKSQELAGIDLLTDGELSRFDPNHPETNGMIDYFIRPLAGLGAQLSRAEREDFRANAGMSFRAQPAGVVRGKIDEGLLDLPAAWSRIKALTDRPLKFTVTSPYMLAKTLVDQHYGDLQTLTFDIAEVLRRQVAALDAPVVQVDEANLPGHAQDATWAHEPINHLLTGVRGVRAMHFCFGNYGGQSIQQGYWRDLMSFFNRLEVDHLVLEFARRIFHSTALDELAEFADLKDSIHLGLGVIDIKDNAVETPEEIARRIEVGVRKLGADRLQWIHPDCGFWMLPRSVADRKMAALVTGRDLFEGRRANHPG